MATMSEAELRIHKKSHNKQNSWWLHDVKNIPVSRVCNDCEKSVKAQYNPAIFGESSAAYEDVVEEPIEPDY